MSMILKHPPRNPNAGIVTAEQVMANVERRENPMDRDRNQADARALTVGEAAEVFRVNPKTINRYLRGGKFPEGGVFTTLGGHHRVFRWALRIAILDSAEGSKVDDVEALIDAGVASYKKKHMARLAEARDKQTRMITQRPGE